MTPATPQPPIRVADGEVRPGDTVYVPIFGVPALVVLGRDGQDGPWIIISDKNGQYSELRTSVCIKRSAAIAIRKMELLRMIDAGQAAARELAELEAEK